MKSIVEERGRVPFPVHTFERVYMEPFYKREGLPKHLERWQGTVDAMLEGIDTEGPIYLMVDQGIVSPFKSHRRGGMHIDGYWIPELQTHGGGGRHYTEPSKHGTFPRHGMSIGSEWPIEGILLASSISACKALSGEFDGEIGVGGDCSHMDLSSLKEHHLQSGICYAGNVTMLHESLPTDKEYLRTLVRMNIPGWEPIH